MAYRGPSFRSDPAALTGFKLEQDAADNAFQRELARAQLARQLGADFSANVRAADADRDRREAAIAELAMTPGVRQGGSSRMVSTMDSLVPRRAGNTFSRAGQTFTFDPFTAAEDTGLAQSTAEDEARRQRVASIAQIPGMDERKAARYVFGRAVDEDDATAEAARLRQALANYVKTPSREMAAEAVRAGYDLNKFPDRYLAPEADPTHPGFELSEQGGLSEYQRAQLLLQREAMDKPQRVQVTNPDGTTTFKWLRPGEEATSAAKPGGGTGGMGQAIQARLLAAVSEARAADERMRQYESKLLKGEAKPGALQAFGGNLAMNLAGAHSATGAGVQALAEISTEPEYLQYRRDAALIARAEQLMSSRGGSEAAVLANQLLARGAANLTPESIDAAQKSRQAIFGKVGGVAQALTPEQLRKLEEGLDALRRGENDFDYAGAGAVLRGGELKEVPPDDLARAKSDPKFAEWLKQNGYRVP